MLVVAPEERREVFLEILHAGTEEQWVAVIELLPPSNKQPGPGRKLYLRKQRHLLGSATHLIEIDLLRGGKPTVAIPPAYPDLSPYRVVVSNGHDRMHRKLYRVFLHRRLPRIEVPLRRGDAPAVLDLHAVFEDTWQKAQLGRRVDYSKDPPGPPLEGEEAAFARAMLVKAGLVQA